MGDLGVWCLPGKVVPLAFNVENNKKKSLILGFFKSKVSTAVDQEGLGLLKLFFVEKALWKYGFDFYQDLAFVHTARSTNTCFNQHGKVFNWSTFWSESMEYCQQEEKRNHILQRGKSDVCYESNTGLPEHVMQKEPWLNTECITIQLMDKLYTTPIISALKVIWSVLCQLKCRFSLAVKHDYHH